VPPAAVRESSSASGVAKANSVVDVGMLGSSAFARSSTDGAAAHGGAAAVKV